MLNIIIYFNNDMDFLRSSNTYFTMILMGFSNMDFIGQFSLHVSDVEESHDRQVVVFYPSSCLHHRKKTEKLRYSVADLFMSPIREFVSNRLN